MYNRIATSTIRKLIMKQLQDAFNDAFQKVLDDKIIEKSIESKVSELTESIVKNSLSRYSDFGEKIQEKVNEMLNGIDLRHMGIEGYNDMVLKVLKLNFDAMVTGSINTQLTETMTKILMPVPSEIKLSELVRSFIEFEVENDKESAYNRGKITVIIGEPLYIGSNYKTIYIDAEPNQDMFSCTYQVSTNGSEAFSVKVNKRNINESLFVGPLYDFDLMMFRMATAKTKLIIDEVGDTNYQELNEDDNDD